MKKLKALKRERVNRALESIFDYPLTIVEAPIGYGKTTAVREFLSTKGSPVLWLSFLSPEDTASFFWDRLAKEIGRVDEAAGGRLKNLGFPSNTPQVANILSILNSLHYEENTALVIDDFHLVKSPQIGTLLSQIVKEEPENLHIVVITRDATNLDLAELIAKGLCNILSQQLLRFTDREIRDYCAMMGRMPAEDDLAKICEYTGGWVSLIYLILLGLEKGIPVGMNNVIDELVERVLYNAYDEPIRQFLLKLAVMDGFTAAQAMFVTQEAKAEKFLKKLRRENAFIIYDEAADVYKIHKMLLDFLRMKQTGNVALKTIYRQVGEWHLEQREYTAAYRYFYRAGEAERILALLNNKDNVTNDFAEFEGSFEMFKTMSRELLCKYPLTYLQYISLLLLSGDPVVAQDGANRLDELQQVYEQLENIHPNLKKRILAEINVVRIFVVFNNAEKMIACTHEASHLLEGGQSCLMQRESEFTFGCPHFLYSYYREPGNLKKTVDIMVNGFPAFARLAHGCGTGCEYVTLAEYALETGDWPAAELNAFKAIYKARTKKQTGITICANFALIRLYILQEETVEGLELLRQLRKDVAKENSAIYNTSLDLCEGYIYGCLGQLGRIPLWLRSGDISSARFLYQGMAFNYIVYGKAVLLAKNYLELEMLTEAFDEHFSLFNNQLGFIHNRIYEAAAKYRLYGEEKGCAALRKVLDMGQADHIILPFAENAPTIINMMRLIAHANTRNEYVRAVLLCCEQYMESLKHTPKSTIKLSARELEVLALAAEGLKRVEIAGRLMVSAGTVKTHLENIYRKLEVSGKTAAIKKATALRLF